jgi:hypothetical protein
VTKSTNHKPARSPRPIKRGNEDEDEEEFKASMKSGVSTPRGLKNIQKKQISSAAAGNNHQSE